MNESTRPPAAHCHRPQDADRYVTDATRWMLVIYASLAAALSGAVPVWLLAPAIIVAYARGALLVHELMHVRRATAVNRLIAMMMLFDTPLGLGYREYQRIHMLHHRWAGDPRDPEHYQIAGGRLRALVGAMLASELAMIHWLRAHGLSRSLAVESLQRAAAFALLLAINPLAFAGYWVVMRVTIGAANFAFHHVVHSRDGELGDFRFETTPFVDRIVGLVLGPRLSPVLFDHPGHHAWPRVRAEHLPGLLSRHPPPRRSTGARTTPPSSTHRQVHPS